MYRVIVHFHDDLNYFLPHNRQNSPLPVSFREKRSIKDLIESLGVPHVEVDAILHVGMSVDFSHIIERDDTFHCYPFGADHGNDAVIHLVTPPRDDPRFVCDVHLRQLVRRLRLMGFDTLFEEGMDDEAIAQLAASQNRIVLTRDRGLLRRRIVTRGRIVRSTDPDGQITEIIERLNLKDRCDPFSRCIECNGLIEVLDMESIAKAPDGMNIPPGVRSWCSEYYRCSGCGRIYWRGSHYDRLRRRADAIVRVINGNG